MASGIHWLPSPVKRLGNRVILAILGRWMIGPIVQLTADAAVLTYDCEVHRDGCIF
mgnify:FL=1